MSGKRKRSNTGAEPVWHHIQKLSTTHRHKNLLKRRKHLKEVLTFAITQKNNLPEYPRLPKSQQKKSTFIQ